MTLFKSMLADAKRWGERVGTARARAAIRCLQALEKQDETRIAKLMARLEAVHPAGQAGARPGPAMDAVVLAVHQTLFSRMARGDMRGALMLASCDTRFPLRAPIPSVWRKTLRAEGVAVSGLASASFFMVLVARSWLGGARMIWRVLRQKGMTPAPSEPYGVLVTAGKAANFTPRARRGGADRCWDYLSWYQHWDGRDPTIKSFWAQAPAADPVIDARSRFVDWALPRAEGTAWRMGFLMIGLRRAIQALSALCVGRWQDALILRERTLADYVRALPASTLAGEYLFEIANASVIRPLWTQIAEARGARIIFVHYSANSMLFGTALAPRYRSGAGHALTTWPEHVLLSDDQKAGLASVLRYPARVHLDPLVGHNDSGAPLDTLPTGPRVALFDVAPNRRARAALAGVVFSYYTAGNVSRFLEDCVEATTQQGLAPILKAKREDRKIVDHRYDHAKRMLAGKGLSFVDTGIAPIRLIRECDICISLPFTSTALVGTALGKPSIYYDPGGAVASHTPSLHGVPVIGGKEALQAWLHDACRDISRSSKPSGMDRGVLQSGSDRDRH